MVFYHPSPLTTTHSHRGKTSESPLNKEGLFIKRGDLRGPAWWFLVFSINNWLQELDDLDTPIAPRMVWSELDRRPQFVSVQVVCSALWFVRSPPPFREAGLSENVPSATSSFRLDPGSTYLFPYLQAIPLPSPGRRCPRAAC